MSGQTHHVLFSPLSGLPCPPRSLSGRRELLHADWPVITTSLSILASSPANSANRGAPFYDKVQRVRLVLHHAVHAPYEAVLSVEICWGQTPARANDDACQVFVTGFEAIA
ncbi:hypothetical protein VTO42DRAFT_2696 [Malbranchea cinnamomea]